MTDPVELRFCNCADPENCRETVPGYVCRKGAAAPVPCAASPADPWQPIQTAPRGKRVLALMKPEPLASEGEITWAYWTTVEDEPLAPEGMWTFDQSGELCEPTHWMPLPSPPRATGEGARDGHQQTIETPPPTTGEVWGKTTASADSWAIGIGSSQAATIAPRRDPTPEAAPVAVSLDPHRLLAQVDDSALWKVLNEADEHKASWSVDAWRQWFVQLIDAASELSCRLEDPDFVARLRSEE